MYAALTGEHPGFADEEDASFHLRQKLEGRNCLVVIDDVWDAGHLNPFLRASNQCARLVTARRPEIATNAKRVNVDEMRVGEAVALLAMGMPGRLPPDFQPEKPPLPPRRKGIRPLAAQNLIKSAPRTAKFARRCPRPRAWCPPRSRNRRDSRPRRHRFVLDPTPRAIPPSVRPPVCRRTGMMPRVTAG